MPSVTARYRPTLVLLHGWGVNRCIWAPVVDRLRPHYRVLALDLPGYGEAGVLREADDLGSIAEQVADRVEEAAVWVGWSLGSLVAMQVALSRPGRVTRLVLVGANAKFVADPEWPHGVALGYMQRMCRDLAADYPAAITRFLLLQSGRLNCGRAAARQMREMINSCGAPGPAALRRSLSILTRSDLRPQVAGLRVPTQLIHGRLDRIAPPAAAEYLVQRIPDAELSLLTAGHAPFITHTEDFVTLTHRGHGR